MTTLAHFLFTEMDKITIRRATPEDKESVMSIRDIVYSGNDFLPAYYDRFMTSPDIISAVMLYDTRIVSCILYVALRCKLKSKYFGMAHSVPIYAELTFTSFSGQVHFHKDCLVVFQNYHLLFAISVLNENSVDPDRTTRSVASDLGIHCIPLSLYGTSDLNG